jgi:hypothetical protein
VILDELCATTGWHRNHARKALRQSLGPRRVAKPRKRRPPTYDGEVLDSAALGVGGDGRPGRQEDGAVPA